MRKNEMIKSAEPMSSVLNQNLEMTREAVTYLKWYSTAIGSRTLQAYADDLIRLVNKIGGLQQKAPVAMDMAKSDKDKLYTLLTKFERYLGNFEDVVGQDVPKVEGSMFVSNTNETVEDGYKTKVFFQQTANAKKAFDLFYHNYLVL